MDFRKIVATEVGYADGGREQIARVSDFLVIGDEFTLPTEASDNVFIRVNFDGLENPVEGLGVQIIAPTPCNKVLFRSIWTKQVQLLNEETNELESANALGIIGRPTPATLADFCETYAGYRFRVVGRAVRAYRNERYYSTSLLGLEIISEPQPPQPTAPQPTA